MQLTAIERAQLRDYYHVDIIIIDLVVECTGCRLSWWVYGQFENLVGRHFGKGAPVDSCQN
jgi:hypothetical protein